MKAFTLKIEELFKMDTGKNYPEGNFNSNKRRLVIPMYQREFKWSNEKIEVLICDIKKRDKFIGNVMLDEVADKYEIVDGQQRITTCFLLLIRLYNYFVSCPREQEALKKYIKPYGSYLLENDSVGDYLSENRNEISININDASDVYKQKEDFIRAYKKIEEILSDSLTSTEIQEFKGKLLDSELLVLINDVHQSTRPVEQLFLDINEKAQLLEVEDIFKGHCFEIYDEALYDDLRNKWISVKKCSSGFKAFGFENTSQYIYLYLLLNIDSSIPESLTINGKHYLDGKTMDDVEKLLVEMQAYGDSIIDFYLSLNDSQYRFRNICENSWEYRNTNDHNILKTMCMTMLAPKGKAQYQKLPLMYFVYSLYKNHDLVMNMTHKQFRKIITNLYVYTNIFITNGAKKSRNDIDHTLRDALRNDTIEEVITAAQELRKNLIQPFDIVSTQCAYDKLAFIYTIVDNYNAAENWIPLIYNRENGYNLEHFLIPDNRTGKIKWIDDNGFEFNLPIEKKKRYKKKAINYMIMNENLNDEMEHNDIVYKIEYVKRWYSARNQHIPKHISIIIAQIESMDEYIYLKGLKGINASLEEVKTAYMDFLDSYFDEEKTELITSLKNAFLQVFRNE